MRWIGESKRLRTLNLTTTIVLAPMALVSCGSQERSRPDPRAIGMAQTAPARPPQPSAETLNARLQALDRAVKRWQAASRLHVAHEAAEETRNLIVGPSGPYYRDANGDGKFAGANTVGILPGLKGGTSLARPDDNACVIADIRGGSWQEPAKRWSQLQSAISRWTPFRNTFPSLPSHVQRVVGWATLTLKSDSLVEVRAHAKHARLHVDIALLALNNCRR